jgi:hypothetical protein
MPCSFGLLLHPRSRLCDQPNGLLELTVTVRCIPLVTAAYGTWVARQAFTTMLGRGEQQLADAVQRIWLATPVAEGGLLGPPSSLINHQVGQPDGVEVVHDHPGVAQRGDQGAGIPTPGVQRGRAWSQPATAALVRSATTSSSRPPRVSMPAWLLAWAHAWTG